MLNIIHKMNICMNYKCQNMIGLIFPEIKQMHQKNVIFVAIFIFFKNVLSMNHIFAMVVMT